jgi:hypothetical protein
MCFSIDLLKSYPSADHHPYSTNMEASSQYIKDVPRVEAKIKSDNVAMPPGVQKHRYPNMPVTNPLYRGPNNWYNEAFLGQTGEKIIATGYESRAGIKDQSPKSNMVSSLITKACFFVTLFLFSCYSKTLFFTRLSNLYYLSCNIGHLQTK